MPNRIPPVPSSITGEIARYLNLVVKQLNNEGYISLFSGVDPNTSGFTGLPGHLLMNIGSASTATRLWQLDGAAASVDTNGWNPIRIA
jgi:hypothetical protein